MIYLDITKSGGAAHRSGLTRVTERIGAELGEWARPVRWHEWDRVMSAGDWFLTAELFSEAERPGLAAFIADSPGRKAAIFHDAIPLKFPHITWPQSVARHPSYMNLLAGFDRLWAVSRASREELLGFWEWQRTSRTPPIDLIALGADFDGSARVTAPRVGSQRASLLSVGIIEPRKNQALLLDVCEALWMSGASFDLDLVGRENPHFGAPIARRIRSLGKRFPQLHYHSSTSDAELGRLYGKARATLFPTLAEGCGLPLLESLWRGVPCVCSDLPVLRENADGGGCLAVAVNDTAAWEEALRNVIEDDALHGRLTAETVARPLPTWRQAAEELKSALG